MAIETYPSQGSDYLNYQLAVDKVGSAYYGVSKIDIGGDGVSVPLVAGSQLSSASLPVVLASDGAHSTSAYQSSQLAQQISAATSLSTIATSSQLIDDLRSARKDTPTAYQAGTVVFAVESDSLASISGEAGNGNLAVLRVDQNGSLWVQLAGALSSSVDSVVVGASPYEGASPYKILDLDETPRTIKSTAGTLYGYYMVNTLSTPLYVKMFDATSVTLGTTVPVLTFTVPGSSSNYIGANMAFPPGIKFSTGIMAAATTGKADNNTGAPATDALSANFLYK